MLDVLFQNAKEQTWLIYLKKIRKKLRKKNSKYFFGVEKKYLSMIEVTGLSFWTCGLLIILTFFSGTKAVDFTNLLLYRERLGKLIYKKKLSISCKCIEVLFFCWRFSLKTLSKKTLIFVGEIFERDKKKWIVVSFFLFKRFFFFSRW